MGRKRRGRGEGSVSQRADGRWMARVSWVDGEGKRRRRCLYGATKKEAQDRLRALQTGIASGSLPDSNRTTLQDWLEHWLGSIKANRANTTHHSYSTTIANHISPILGGVRLQSLRPDQIESLYSTLTRNNIGARTRQLIHAILRRALQVAFVQGIIPRNPADQVERPRVEKAAPRVLTPEQTAHLVTVVVNSGHRLAALLVLAVATGMRQGELFALRWCDLDLDHHRLTVVFSLEEINGQLALKHPKSEASRRTITLPTFAVEALRQHRQRATVEGRHNAEAPVFTDNDGNWLRKSNFVRNVFKPWLALAGVPDIRFHDLRHGHATLMLTLGENPKMVQDRLGHSQIGITMDLYTHVLGSARRDSADRIDQAMREAQKCIKIEQSTRNNEEGN